MIWRVGLKAGAEGAEIRAPLLGQGGSTVAKGGWTAAMIAPSPPLWRRTWRGGMVPGVRPPGALKQAEVLLMHDRLGEFSFWLGPKTVLNVQACRDWLSCQDLLISCGDGGSYLLFVLCADGKGTRSTIRRGWDLKAARLLWVRNSLRCLFLGAGPRGRLLNSLKFQFFKFSRSSRGGKRRFLQASHIWRLRKKWFFVCRIVFSIFLNFISLGPSSRRIPVRDSIKWAKMEVGCCCAGVMVSGPYQTTRLDPSPSLPSNLKFLTVLEPLMINENVAGITSVPPPS